MTIAEAAETVLRNARKSLTAQEIYKEIAKQNLYSFKAKDPKSVVSKAIRQRSDANPKAKNVIFKYVSQGKYTIID